jgi:carbon storage regulator CsrA
MEVAFLLHGGRKREELSEKRMGALSWSYYKEVPDMLVLSRKHGEAIVLPGEEVIVTVLSIQDNRVRIGISAPAKVKLHWGEACIKFLKFACETLPPSEPCRRAPDQAAFAPPEDPDG